jgi:hypothetical protein
MVPLSCFSYHLKVLNEGHNKPAPTNVPIDCYVYGMGCVLPSNSWPCFNQHCITVNIFGLLISTYFFQSIFSNLHLQASYPID